MSCGEATVGNGGGGKALGTLLFIGVIVAFNVLSYTMGWGFYAW